MRDIWFLITDHKGIVKVAVLLIAIFCAISIGIGVYTTSVQTQEQQKQEQKAKKKERKKQIKKSSVTLTKAQQKIVDKYDQSTAQFSALLSSNIWATYSGTGRTLYFTESSIIIADPEANPNKVEKPFIIKGLSTEKVDVGEMVNLTRYNCAYESDDDKTHVLTVDKNDDGTYFKMSIDVENNGTNEEYTRTQAAGSFDIDGIDDGLSEILGNAKDTIEDYVREQCALFYPTAVKASCNGIMTADFNANEYRLDFSLEDSDEQQLTGITVIYHLSNQECELM